MMIEKALQDLMDEIEKHDPVDLKFMILTDRLYSIFKSQEEKIKAIEKNLVDCSFCIPKEKNEK